MTAKRKLHTLPSLQIPSLPELHGPSLPSTPAHLPPPPFQHLNTDCFALSSISYNNFMKSCKQPTLRHISRVKHTTKMMSQALIALPSRDESSREGRSRASMTLDSSTSSSTKPSKHFLVMTAMQQRRTQLCWLKQPSDLHTPTAMKDDSAMADDAFMLAQATQGPAHTNSHVGQLCCS